MIIADHEVIGPTEPSGPGTTLHHPELIPAQTFVITSSRNIDIRHESILEDIFGQAIQLQMETSYFNIYL